MRARTFHSAFGVVAILAGIALFSSHGRPSNQPQPAVSATAQPGDEPVVYSAPTPGLGIAPPVELYVRRVTRVVLVSTLPMGPLVNIALPYESELLGTGDDLGGAVPVSSPGPPESSGAP